MRNCEIFQKRKDNIMENYTVEFQNGFIAEIKAKTDTGAKRIASKMKTYEAGNMALYNSAGALIGRRELETWPGGWCWTKWEKEYE